MEVQKNTNTWSFGTPLPKCLLTVISSIIYCSSYKKIDIYLNVNYIISGSWLNFQLKLHHNDLLYIFLFFFREKHNAQNR